MHHQNGVGVPASTVNLSIDHKPDSENEAIRIKNAGGVVCSGKIGGRLSVSRALGDFVFKDTESVLSYSTGQSEKNYFQKNLQPENQMVSAVPEIFVVERHASSDRFMVIASDGIWDVVSNEDCISLIEGIFDEGEQNIGLVCEELLDQCCSKGSLDNITAFIVKFPPQQVGVGGGVLKRRKKRDELSAKVRHRKIHKCTSKR